MGQGSNKSINLDRQHRPRVSSVVVSWIIVRKCDPLSDESDTIICVVKIPKKFFLKLPNTLRLQHSVGGLVRVGTYHIHVYRTCSRSANYILPLIRRVDLLVIEPIFKNEFL